MLCRDTPLLCVFYSYCLFFTAPRGKRGWKTFYGILKGLILYLQKVRASLITFISFYCFYGFSFILIIFVCSPRCLIFPFITFCCFIKLSPVLNVVFNSFCFYVLLLIPALYSLFLYCCCFYCCSGSLGLFVAVFKGAI